jgi:hypothetical protein
MKKEKTFAHLIRNTIPMWLHLTAICAFLYCLSDHILEALIVLILMYDIGFEIRAIEKLIEYNNTFRRWVYNHLNGKKKTKKNG